ncbi:MAG TPA: hypothetical protein VNC39_10670 [Acidocella sp.]|jgi:hypothetical protein|uniref:hypothetical protein n=1 Tax=Acidocella sp. TaxID=50710 RepID=UPI002C3EAF58|nr:hypothetical protein [Acidocella sp.]HVE22432.1 hypothetical protein [Acidocella sp.]
MDEAFSLWRREAGEDAAAKIFTKRIIALLLALGRHENGDRQSIAATSFDKPGLYAGGALRLVKSDARAIGFLPRLTLDARGADKKARWRQSPYRSPAQKGRIDET